MALVRCAGSGPSSGRSHPGPDRQHDDHADQRRQELRDLAHPDRRWPCGSNRNRCPAGASGRLHREPGRLRERHRGRDPGHGRLGLDSRLRLGHRGATHDPRQPRTGAESRASAHAATRPQSSSQRCSACPSTSRWSTCSSRTTQITASPVSLPHPFTLHNLTSVFTTPGNDLVATLMRTIVITCASMASVVVLGSMLGYYLGRRDGTVQRVMTIVLLLGLAIPFQVILIPVTQVLAPAAPAQLLRRPDRLQRGLLRAVLGAGVLAVRSWHSPRAGRSGRPSTAPARCASFSASSCRSCILRWRASPFSSASGSGTTSSTR